MTTGLTMLEAFECARDGAWIRPVAWRGTPLAIARVPDGLGLPRWGLVPCTTFTPAAIPSLEQMQGDWEVVTPEDLQDKLPGLDDQLREMAQQRLQAMLEGPAM